MSRQYEIVDTAADTFDGWVSKTNDIILLVNTDVVTVASNSAGDITTGNGTVIGIFGANTIFTTELRGGSVTTSNYLTLSSNANLTGAQVNSTANSYLSAANLYFNTTGKITAIGNTAFQANADFEVLRVQSNSTKQSVQINVNSGFIVSGNANFGQYVDVTGPIIGQDTLDVDGVVNFYDKLNVAGAANLQSSANVGGALTVDGASTLKSTLDVTAATTLLGTLALTGNATLSNTISVVGNATFSNSISITGPASFSNTIVISTGAAIGNTSFGTANVSFGNSTVNTVITSTTLQTNTITAFNLNVTGTIVGSFAAGGSVIPTVNNTFTIGSSANVFASSWVTTYYGNTYIVANTSYVSTGTYSFSGTSQVAIDTFNASDYRSAEYTLQFSNTGSSSFHVTKLLVYHDGTTAYSSEYAQMFNSTSLATVTCDYSSGNVRVLVTPSSSTVVAKFTRNLLAV